jgi:hypothetical protein
VDTDRAPEVMQRMLRPLKILAQKHDCAVAIVHHNQKGDSGKRGGQDMLGSVALHAWVENALYVRDKEIGKGGVTTTFIERESKQATDYQFRVRVPLMRVNEDGTRTLWRPELLQGWGRTDEGDTTPEPEDVRSEGHSAPPRPKTGTRQDTARWLAIRMEQLGCRRKGLDAKEIAHRLGNELRTVRANLKKAIERGYVVQEGDLYKVAPGFSRDGD